MNRKLGIVQGRLVESPENVLQWFPEDNWPTEFKIASDIGLHYIELITSESKDENNPIWSKAGRDQIANYSDSSKVKIYSACFDYIIGNDIRNNDTQESIFTFIESCNILGLEKIVLPFFGESELQKSNAEFCSAFEKIIDRVEATKMQICIESLMVARDLKKFISQFQSKKVACVFDTGNKVNLGHDIYEEILELGDTVSHVHIKDKDLNGNNVVLGTGLVDFYSIMEALKQINYTNPLIFETHRGKNPVQTAIHNQQFIKFLEDQFT